MNVTPILDELGRLAWSVAVAVLPLAALFLLFQILFLKLPRREVDHIGGEEGLRIAEKLKGKNA